MIHSATVIWERRPQDQFTNLKYSRVHQWKFDGGAILHASSSPFVVSVPMSDPSVVDPEEAFVASLSSCHMLFFLSIAASRNFAVEKYEDHATGLVTKNEKGLMVMESVTLKPTITFSKVHVPLSSQIEEMHKLSHEKCFLANSVKSKVIILSQ